MDFYVIKFELQRKFMFEHIHVYEMANVALNKKRLYDNYNICGM